MQASKGQNGKVIALELGRSSSFDRKCEESVADELVLQLHSSNFAPSKIEYKDTKTSKTGRSSQEEKKINKPNDEKRSRPRVMREFHNIKISQVGRGLNL